VTCRAASAGGPLLAALAPHETRNLIQGVPDHRVHALVVHLEQTDVMVVTHWAATAPATGKSAEMDIHHWWRFRDGKIYYYRGTEDTAATAAMLSAG
jgi:ketosteroid isomerase-like protein